jgi:hypothetical protein
MRMEPGDNGYFTARTLREFIGGEDKDGALGERTLDRWQKEGIIPPPVKFGTHRRWRKSAVVAALAKIEKQQRRP